MATEKLGEKGDKTNTYVAVKDESRRSVHNGHI